MKISIKLTLLIISCIILVSLALGITSNFIMEKYLLQQAKARLNDTSKFICFKTTNFIKSHKEKINLLSENQIVRQYLLKPTANNHEQINNLLSTIAGNNDTISLLSPKGKELIKIENSKIDTLNEKTFFNFSGNKIEENGFYYQYRNNMFNNLEELYIYKKVYGKENKKIIGLIATKINYGNFYDILKRTFIESDFHVRIINNKTSSLLCGHSETWPKNSIECSTNIDSLNWIVQVALSQKIFKHSLKKLRLSVLLVTIVIVILASLLFIPFSRLISKPITSISKAAQAIADGNFSTNIDINTKDEIGVLAKSFKTMSTKLKDSQSTMELAHQHTIHMLAIASEYKDPETHGHIMRIKRLTTELAIELGIPPEKAKQIGIDSILHDLGKIGIPEEILLKPDLLTSAEYSTMKKHTTIGGRIIGDHEWFVQARQIAISHHEKWDGSGYPEGLKGNDIPLVARIVAVADVFDVLISSRPYKPPWKQDVAIKEIKKQSGRHFDPKVVEALLTLYKEGRLDKYIKRFI